MQHVTKNDPVLDFESFFKDLDLAAKQDIQLALQKFERNLILVLSKLNVRIDVFELEESPQTSQDTFQLLEMPIASNPNDQSEIQQFAQGVAMAFKE